MKERIEELARECNVSPLLITSAAPVIYPTFDSVHKFAQAIHNEALELAAKGCEQSDKSTHPSDCAAAIRKLKV